MQKRNPLTLIIVGILCVASIAVSLIGNKKMDEISKENAKLTTKLEELQKQEKTLLDNQKELDKQKSDLEGKINELQIKTNVN